MYTIKTFTILILVITLLSSCGNPKPTTQDPTSPETPIIIETPTEPTLPILELKVIQTLSGHESNLGKIWSVSSQGILTQQKNSYVHLINAYTGERIKTIVLDGRQDVIISPNGNLIVDNNTLGGSSIWDINSQQLLYTLEEKVSGFSEDGKYLYGQESIFHTQSGKLFFERNKYLTNYSQNSHNSIRGPVFSPDHSIFAIISWVQEKSIIEIRQTSDDKLLQTIPDSSIKNWELENITFNASNSNLLIFQHVAQYSEKPTANVKLWRVSDGKLLNSFTKQYNYSGDDGFYVATDPIKNTFAMQSKDSVQIADLNMGKLLHTFPIPDGSISSHRSNMVFSPDGKTVFTETGDLVFSVPKWEVRNVNDGQLRYSLNTNFDSITFSSDGTMFHINKGNENSIYQLSDGKLLQKFNIDKFYRYTNFYDNPYGLVFMPDNKTILAATLKSTIADQKYDDMFRLFQISDGAELASYTSGTSDHATFTLNKDSTLLASSHDGLGPVNIWNFSEGKLLTKIINQAPTTISSIHFNPDNTSIATIRTDSFSNPIRQWVDFWNLETGQWLYEITDTSGKYGFSSDGTRFSMGSSQWDTETKQRITYPLATYSPLSYTAYNSDNSILIYSGQKHYQSDDSTVDLWNTSDGQNLKSFLDTEGRVSHDGKLLLLRDATTNKIELWNLNLLQKVHTLNTNSAFTAVRWSDSINFSSDNQRVAFKISNTEVQIWNTESGLLEQTVTVNNGFITRTDLSPNGEFISISNQFPIDADSYNYREEISLWRVSDGVLVKQFKNLVNAPEPYSLAFSSDGTKLIIGLGHVDYGNTITVYGTPNNDPIFINQNTN